MTLTYSIIIPIKDEEENIEPLTAELEPVMDKLKKTWELIFIDDGSQDSSLKLLTKLAKEKDNVRVISFSQNFGQSSAFDAGFKAARGDIIITLDGDRQNDPADIPKVVEAIQDCDLVCGQRIGRRDPWTKRWISKLANTVRSRVCQDGMRDTGCSLKAYRRSCLLQIKLYHGMHRFLPALFKIEGFRIKSVPVSHRPRTQGKSKYRFVNRSLQPLCDMFAVLWMRRRQLKYQIQREIP